MTSIYNLRNLPEIQQQDISRSEQKTAWQNICQNTWQNIKSVLKIAARVTAGLPLIGEQISSFIKSIITSNGVKVEPRAGESNLISLNKSLKREISDCLNSDANLKVQTSFKRNEVIDTFVQGSDKEVQNTRKEEFSNILRDISDETLSHMSSAFIKDCPRAKYLVGGEIKESPADKLKAIVNLCTENGVVDHEALELLTKIANQSSQGSIMIGIMKSFEKEKKLYKEQQQKDQSFSITSETVNGRKEYIVVGYCKTELMDLSKGILTAKGFQSYQVRLKQDETGAWKAHLEDARHFLKPEKGYSREDITIESSKIRDEFRNDIRDIYTLHNNQQITKEIIKKTPLLNDKQAQNALDLVSPFQNALKAFNKNEISTSEMFNILKELKKDYNTTFKALNPDPENPNVPNEVFLPFALEVAIKTGDFSQDDKQRIFNNLVTENTKEFLNLLKDEFLNSRYLLFNLRFIMAYNLMQELGIDVEAITNHAIRDQIRQSNEFNKLILLD